MTCARGYRQRLARGLVRYLVVAFCLLSVCLIVAFFHQPSWTPNSNNPKPAGTLSKEAANRNINFGKAQVGNNVFDDNEVLEQKLKEVSPSPIEFASERRSKDPDKENEIMLEEISGWTDGTLLHVYEALAKEPTLLNWNLPKDDVDVVVTIQIHDRASYLSYLFESFRHVPTWNGTLFILTHDFYSPEINALVRNCTFAPIIDVYYPVPNQIFKNRFPGEDPRDCKSRDLSPELAKKQGCYNANYPDKYGHYREEKYAQTKYHSIWKFHWIFDEIVPKYIPSFDGPVLLLEEDYYVSPDVLHLLRQAWKLAGGNYQIITLGNDKDIKFGDSANRFVKSNWIDIRGMSLVGSTWNLIKPCVNTFCDYDDYNWDWSLQFTAATCTERTFNTLNAVSARIFHVGECGGFHFEADGKCVAEEKVQSIKQTLSDNANSLFPATLHIEKDAISAALTSINANGGWGDPRDRFLCRALGSGSYTDILKAVIQAQMKPISSLQVGT